MDAEPPPEPARVDTASLAADSTHSHHCGDDGIKSRQIRAMSNESTESTTSPPTAAHDKKQQQQPPQPYQQQRGTRKHHPRPKRNRKRPRSQIHGYSNDNLVIQSKVMPLTLNGQPILTCIPASAPSSSPSSSSSSSSLPTSLSAVNGQSVDDAEPSSSSSRSTLFVRVIEPYPYTFTSHAKSRWIGRTILDVYSTEFGSYPASYYEAAIRQGRILVSDKVVDASYCIRDHDILCHVVHRHEPAVLLHCGTAPFVNVVGETSTLLAVDKPGTLPIHPCGAYHENCLLQLLQPVYGKLYTIYRLDRLTSGLVIFGKTSAAAQVCSTAMKQRHRRGSSLCHKIYVARVKGHFPRNCPLHVPVLAPASSHDEQKPPLFPIFDGVVHDDDNTIENGNDEVAVAAMRRRNAFGYWFSNSTGANNVGDSQNLSLEQFSTLEHSADEWLQALDQKKKEQVSNDCDDSSCMTAHSDLVWLDFACPVRVSNPQVGVCVRMVCLATCLHFVKSAPPL
jgi:RNA pseudouridylate synthase